jgi:hypothetical protein
MTVRVNCMTMTYNGLVVNASESVPSLPTEAAHASTPYRGVATAAVVPKIKTRQKASGIR